MKRILFLSRPYLSPKEGYERRVWEMDQAFAALEKEYLPLPDLKKNLKNFIRFLNCCSKADYIYLHSLSSAAHAFYRITAPLWTSKVIWDVHGLVPEELEFSGRDKAAINFAGLEKVVSKNCLAWIAVTESMKSYLLKKLPALEGKKSFVIPSAQRLKADLENQKKYEFVYSGGAQAWQNIELIREVLTSNPNAKTLVLSSETEAISKVLNWDRVELRFEQGTAYSRSIAECKMGFLLRNEHILNECSFPTKLMDYLQNSVVPILMSPHLADVSALGIQYIQFEDLKMQRFPESSHLYSMAEINKKIAEMIFQRKDAEMKALLKMLL